jgi:CHAT domain-containing protein
MIAGTRTVVGSLWNVDDSLATDLMQRFYSNLARVMTKARRVAQNWL